jgi:type II secretory pathway component PulK
MTTPTRRQARDERGASLVLAIAFVVVIGALAAATLAAITSAFNNRSSLDASRDREYSADAGVEYAIAAVRAMSSPGITSCQAPNPTSYSYTVGGITIRVDCANNSTLTFNGFAQRNVVFTACKETGVACTSSSSIIRAQVNYEAIGQLNSPTIIGTVVQSWSVNG